MKTAMRELKSDLLTAIDTCNETLPFWGISLTDGYSSVMEELVKKQFFLK
jgi:hypothetical protein